MGGEEQAGSINKTKISSDVVINLDHGDPNIFESYWQNFGEKCTVVISGSQFLSYFSDTHSICWFLEPKLEEEIKRLHRVVGNVSMVDDYNIVIGTGSTQLLQAALYALCPPDASKPVNVVSTAPYYSCYPEITNFLRSGLYKWAGDALTYNEDGPYIEFVTSPNNPDGRIREATVKKGQGRLVHDLAYYWPHYTPITSCVGYDLMLFTFSKCTGHAGSRIGWALVKDKDVARKMTEFICNNTIGVSRDSQIRAAKILGLVSDSCLNPHGPDNFFQYGQILMTERWEKLKEVVVGGGGIFSLPHYPKEHCLFTGRCTTEAHPAFAWMKCNKRETEDCEKLLREHKILARSGMRFGGDPKNVRVSLVGREEEFNLFLERLMDIQNN